MKRLLILTLVIFLCQSVLAQDSASRWSSRLAYYLKASVSQSNKKTSNLYLADVNDTAVFLTADPARFRQPFMTTNNIAYQNLQVISVHRRGSFGRGALTGGLIGGLSVGAIAAASTQCHDCSGPGVRGLAFVGGAIVGGFIGGLIGGIIGGSTERRFIIGGDKQKFDKMRLSVLEMAYGKSFKKTN